MRCFRKFALAFAESHTTLTSVLYAYLPRRSTAVGPTLRVTRGRDRRGPCVLCKGRDGSDRRVHARVRLRATACYFHVPNCVFALWPVQLNHSTWLKSRRLRIRAHEDQHPRPGVGECRHAGNDGHHNRSAAGSLANAPARERRHRYSVRPGSFDPTLDPDETPPGRPVFAARRWSVAHDAHHHMCPIALVRGARSRSTGSRAETSGRMPAQANAEASSSQLRQFDPLRLRFIVFLSFPRSLTHTFSGGAREFCARLAQARRVTCEPTAGTGC